MKYCVYIVECRDGSFYTGITTNLEKRIKEHNGELKGGAKYTKGKGPVVLKYFEKLETRSDALKREYEIKQLTRKQKQKIISLLV